MSQFDTGLPSVRQIQNFIKDQQQVELQLSTNEQIVGKIIWQDHDCIFLVNQDNQSMLIWRQALVYIKFTG